MAVLETLKIAPTVFIAYVPKIGLYVSLQQYFNVMLDHGVIFSLPRDVLDSVYRRAVLIEEMIAFYLHDLPAYVKVRIVPTFLAVDVDVMNRRFRLVLETDAIVSEPYVVRDLPRRRKVPPVVKVFLSLPGHHFRA